MRPFAALVLTSVLALGGCSAQRPAPVVCYHLTAGDCLMVAAAVLDDAESSAVLVVVVVPWRGCFPGSFCPLVQGERQALVATVGIRFDDGRRSVLRQTGSLDDRPLNVTAGPVNVGADTFIDAYANTRGVLVLGTLPVTSRSQ